MYVGIITLEEVCRVCGITILGMKIRFFAAVLDVITMARLHPKTSILVHDEADKASHATLGAAGPIRNLPDLPFMP